MKKSSQSGQILKQSLVSKSSPLKPGKQNDKLNFNGTQSEDDTKSFIISLLKNTEIVEECLKGKNLKKIIQESGAVEEYLSEKVENAEQPVSKMADSLMEDHKFFDNITTNLASNTLFVNEVASKLSSLILENEEIKQAMFDSFSLQFQQEIDSLKSNCANLQAKNYELKLEVERGEQYSRRNYSFSWDQL